MKGKYIVKKVIECLKGYTKECILGPLLKFTEAFFELLVPLVIASIIDDGIKTGDKGHIIRCVILLAIFAALGFVASITAQRFSARAAVGCATNLRSKLFAHIQGLSFTELDDLGTSTMITRMTSDIDQIQTGVNMCLRLLLRSPFVVFGAVAMAFYVDSSSALVFAVVVPVLFAVVAVIMALTIPLYKRVQRGLDKVLALVRENLIGVRVIRAFNNQKSEKEQFENQNSALTTLQMKVSKISAFLNPITYVLINLAVVTLIYVGGLRVDSGAIENGDVIALYNYMSQILVELIKFASLVVTLTRSIACAKRVESVFEIKNSQTSGEDKTVPESDTAIEFKNVSLTYNGAGAKALDNISFEIKSGETLGIIGSSGSGKSSLVGLIPRFYDATEGEVRIFGKNALEYDVEALRKNIAVVMQKNTAFAGTVRDNVCFGKLDANDAEIWRALEISQLADTVKEKGEGLELAVLQDGKNLSGGQRQRLNIARAIVRNPKILILDDSSSALDYATDARLRASIRENICGITLVIVSQRTSSIRNADKILVLDEGEAVGFGTHDELLDNCSVYREIHNSQFGAGGETK